MKLVELLAMVLVTISFGVVVARDITHSGNLKDDDFMITEDENSMGQSKNTDDQIMNRMGNQDLGNCDFNGQYKPHPNDCLKFVQCSWKTPIEMTCSPGTYWLQSKLTCDHLPSTTCGINVEASESTSTISTCSCGIAKPFKRIIGGDEAKMRYPWHVGIAFGTSLTCGGSIINNKYILTAAHCVKNYEPSKMPRVLVGLHNFKQVSPSKIKSVKRVIIHPCYICDINENDFALLELNDPLVYDDVTSPVCLPDDDLETYIGEKAIVTGWGYTTPNGTFSEKLKELGVDIIDNTNCQSSWRGARPITPNMLCVEGPNNGLEMHCDGDSGGPLIVEDDNSRYVQVGVVSFSASGTDSQGQVVKCNVPGYPGVYARVSKVLDWIKAESASGQYCDK